MHLFYCRRVSRTLYTFSSHFITCKKIFLQAYFLQILLKLTWANSNWQYLKKLQWKNKTIVIILRPWLGNAIIIFVRGHSHIEPSNSLRQNDAKFQAHPPITLLVKMPNLPKTDVYNFRYKINVGILMKLFFLLHK